jgi:hypothetical protein
MAARPLKISGRKGVSGTHISRTHQEEQNFPEPTKKSKTPPQGELDLRCPDREDNKGVSELEDCN